jgi:hypothetical protein
MRTHRTGVLGRPVAGLRHARRGITNAAIVSADTGEVAVELLVIDRSADLVECVSVSEFQGHGRRELRRIGKDPSGYFRGQLEGVS